VFVNRLLVRFPEFRHGLRCHAALAGAFATGLALALVIGSVTDSRAADTPGQSAAQEHAAPARAQSQDPHAQRSPAAKDPAHAGQAQETHAQTAHAEEAHGESLWAFVARLLNFAILAGALVYFLREPLMSHLRDRADRIREDLAHAEQTRQAATAQMSAIERKLAELPAELDALRRRGSEEIAAESTRIRELASQERLRVLEQSRREMDHRVRMARQELADHAATLAVEVAAKRLSTIGPQDHQRLIDRYAQQVRTAHG
jgi:F-type H+-transporting ATPase subunit b